MCTPSRRLGPLAILRFLGQPKIALMYFLGFASGLPFMLVANTMGYWLRDSGVELATIGFLSWVGLTYSLKFLWSPLIDRTDAPLLGRWLGRRRGWMALTQLGVMAALAGMAAVGPQGHLGWFGVMALLAAFAAASQDIVIDAWRIESAEHSNELAILSSAYLLGYRTALLLSEALILLIAAWGGWPLSYLLMAAAMTLGLTATLLAKEPPVSRQVASTTHMPMWTLQGLDASLLGPFRSFFRQHGQLAWLMLLVICLYRLPEYIPGPMFNPFYIDLGLSKETVGTVRASFGLAATLAGIASAGIFALRFGRMATLIVGAISGSVVNLSFAALVWIGHSPPLFAAAMMLDNFGQSFAGVALVAYMSSLTSAEYTATQYALLSSLYALLGKLLKGFSGTLVETLQQLLHSKLDGYAWFFSGTILLGMPTLALCLWLAWREKAQRLQEVPQP